MDAKILSPRPGILHKDVRCDISHLPDDIEFAQAAEASAEVWDRVGPLNAPTKASGYIYNEVIVLMSDGLNTLDRWYGDGSSTQTSVDRRMYESSTLGTCANIKTTGITIYTVNVNTDGDPMSTLLKNCASSADKFWMVTSAN